MKSKVIILGTSLADKRDTLCVIKSGEYKQTADGILSALKDGLFDKYGEFPPDFKVLAIAKKATNAQHKDIDEYAVVLNCMHDDGKTVAAVYTAVASFQ